jgi:hypothetical protein
MVLARYLLVIFRVRGAEALENGPEMTEPREHFDRRRIAFRRFGRTHADETVSSCGPKNDF